MYDLILVHSPSIYDFRKKSTNLGPISDVVPSTPIFEMYPIGFMSILNNVISNGFKAKIVNLAVKMIYHKNFDVRNYIKKQESQIYGLDLHWLPHVQGSIEVAKIIKEEHPDSKIVFGGLSSTYYAIELLKNYEFIDFVLKGDTTEPFFPLLIDAVERNNDLSSIPNLAWRDNSKIVENQCRDPDKDIDKVSLDYRIIYRNAVKTMSAEDHLPYGDWVDNPSAMTLIQKGCNHNCTICGGSNFAYKNFYCRNKVSFRNIDTIVSELKSIQENLGSPAFITGDIHEAGKDFDIKLLEAVKREGIDIPILFELFSPAPESYYQTISKNISEFTVEISPESSNENIRAISGKYYANSGLEKNIEYAMKYDARRMDLFFSVGIPGQSVSDVDNDVEYVKKLYAKFPKNLSTFISPISPFVDPGSLAFEKSELYGLKIKAKTLKDHYNLLNSNDTWIDFLNYETDKMTKNDIAYATYKSALELVKLRAEKGAIVDDNLKGRIEEQLKELDQNILKRGRYMGPIIFEKDDLVWSKKSVVRNMHNVGLEFYRFIKKI
ncbi:MAG: TIGR04190 family B12-binding domain/radical SAM domain protein [Thermoplasmata archaeon]